MIVVTRRNQEKIYLNPTNIEMVEQHEDALITLINGKKLVAVESAEEINRQLLHWWREVFKINYLSGNNDNKRS